LADFKYSRRLDALTRLFSSAEVRVDRNTSVLSPGFAGSGTGTNVFSAPYPNGTAVAGGYTLYSRVASAGLDAEIKRVTTELKKWNPGPFEAIGGQAMIDLVVALPGFVKAGSELVAQGSGTAVASVDPKLYVGVLNGEIKVQVPLVETNDLNLSIFKSFGNFAANNPLGHAGGHCDRQGHDGPLSGLISAWTWPCCWPSGDSVSITGLLPPISLWPLPVSTLTRL
jgi:hypothetical protein